MAISAEERELLEQFYDKNKDLFIAILDMMADDEDADSKAVSSARKMLTGKDYSKYEFDGKTYNKRNLVLAVIKKYINDNKPNTLDDLKSAFPEKIIRGVSEAPGSFRHYDESVKTLDGSEAWVLNQWGLDNIIDFISFVTTTHGYVITKVT